MIPVQATMIWCFYIKILEAKYAPLIPRYCISGYKRPAASEMQCLMSAFLLKRELNLTFAMKSLLVESVAQTVYCVLPKAQRDFSHPINQFYQSDKILSRVITGRTRKLGSTGQSLQFQQAFPLLQSFGSLMVAKIFLYYSLLLAKCFRSRMYKF